MTFFRFKRSVRSVSSIMRICSAHGFIVKEKTNYAVLPLVNGTLRVYMVRGTRNPSSPFSLGAVTLWTKNGKQISYDTVDALPEGIRPYVEIVETKLYRIKGATISAFGITLSKNYSASTYAVSPSQAVVYLKHQARRAYLSRLQSDWERAELSGIEIQDLEVVPDYNPGGKKIKLNHRLQLQVQLDSGVWIVLGENDI